MPGAMVVLGFRGKMEGGREGKERVKKREMEEGGRKEEDRKNAARQ